MEASWKSLRVSEKFILEASWDLLEVVSNGVVLFLTVSVLLLKIIQKSTPKLPKSSPKPSRIHPKTSQNLPKNSPKTRSGGDCASDRFWMLSTFDNPTYVARAVAGASWDHLGAVLGRLAASWSRPGTTSGRSWAVLGASWGVLAHLGGVLGASWGILEAFRDNFHEEVRFFIDFCSQLRCPKPKKSLIFHWFYMHF